MNSLIWIDTAIKTDPERKHQARWFSQFSSVQLLRRVWLFAMRWTAAPGYPVHHQLLELAQAHVHWVGDAIQPSHPLSFPSSRTFSLSQHQGLFLGVSSSHPGTKVLELQLQHQSFQWIFRTDFLWIDWFDLLAVQRNL